MTSIDNTLKKRYVTLVVLGDFGRSPRMQYHALSLTKNEYEVNVVAYKGSEPFQEIIKSNLIHLNYMKEVPNVFCGLPRIIHYVLKTLWQSLFLFMTLLQISNIGCIFIQNPPAVPTLPICWFVSKIKNCSFFIDFHNYGFTILSLSAGRKSLLVKMAEWCEKKFSQKAIKSICVTKAMKDDLSKNWNVRASVFYDCAPDFFHPIELKEKHLFFMEIGKEYKEFQHSSPENGNQELTRFTKKVGNQYEFLPDRPALLISSTSWTEDEDFAILLSALEEYESAAKELSDLPNLVVAITGKGALKSHYEMVIKDKNFTHVQIVTMWLKFEDYPTFLACADLGVSLHSSSSGLDLPMKVVDMFGVGLPVAALAFNCIDELVKEDVNGKTFATSQQLSAQLKELFTGFPKRNTKLRTFRDNLQAATSLRWDENWNHTVAPLFREIFQQSVVKQKS